MTIILRRLKHAILYIHFPFCMFWLVIVIIHQNYMLIYPFCMCARILTILILFNTQVFSSPEQSSRWAVVMGRMVRRPSCVVSRPSCDVHNWLVNTLEVTVLVLCWSNLVNSFFATKSRTSSKLGHVGSKTRSRNLFLEKACEHSRGHSFGPIMIKFGL